MLNERIRVMREAGKILCEVSGSLLITVVVSHSDVNSTEI